jgi:hypothetical protein
LDWLRMLLRSRSEIRSPHALQCFLPIQIPFQHLGGSIAHFSFIFVTIRNNDSYIAVKPAFLSHRFLRNASHPSCFLKHTPFSLQFSNVVPYLL